MRKKVTETAEAGQIVEDAQALLSATANIAEAKVMAARERLSNALRQGREMLGDFKDKADETVHDHPYQAIGVALGVGALVGFLLGRRS